MPARRKTLDALIHDRTFLGRRHADLLDGPPVRDPVLRAIQASFQAEASDLRRRELALAFERAVREGPNGLTMAQELLATCGMPLAAEVDDDGTVVGGLFAAWERWDRRYGLRFRLFVGCANNSDRIEVARRAGVAAAETRLEEIEERWTELVAKVYPRGLRRVPAPPGWD